MTLAQVSRITLAVLVLAAAAPPAAGDDAKDIESALLKMQEEGLLDDPEDIMAWVAFPRVVKRGERAVLKISIENGREEAAFRLSSVQIGDPFLDGFQVGSITPEPRNKDAGLEVLVLDYPRDLKPGEVLEIEIALEAKKPGVYIGDVDIVEGAKFLTRPAQARVKP